jgi:hypothetical protein
LFSIEHGAVQVSSHRVLGSFFCGGFGFGGSAFLVVFVTSIAASSRLPKNSLAW